MKNNFITRIFHEIDIFGKDPQLYYKRKEKKRRTKMNEFLNALKSDTNYGLTENGGIKRVTTLNPILDMFGMGGSMRNRSDDDVILMFKNAYEEDKDLALRCLFYLRDVRGGQGERRFFRVCYHWLAEEYPYDEVTNYHLKSYQRYSEDVFSFHYKFYQYILQ